MIDLDYTLNSDPAEGLLKRLAEALDPDQILDAAADMVLEHTLTRFLMEEDPDHERWTPLAPSTLKQREREGTGNQILFRTGALFHSIEILPGSNPFERVIGSFSDYGIFHQEGTSRMPQRMFLGITDEEPDQVLLLILHRIQGALS